ncbi:MAG: right-handed parallel beta-helix repeat-containing protein [Bacteroidota bacterium]
MKNINHPKIRIASNLLGSLFFIFALLPDFCHAATYYISSSKGNDSYQSSQAREQLTPWKSIEKVNQFFKYLKGGDTILFKRGDVFEGTIIPSKSGSYFAPIYFGAYGTGKEPEITGSVAISSWKEVKNGIYASQCLSTGTNLIINNKQQQIGRYPNNGYLTIQSSVQGNLLTGPQLQVSNYNSGAEVVIRKTRWIIDRSPVLSQTGNSLTYEANKNLSKKGYGYFIQNDINTLDKAGEWCYDKSKKILYVYFGNKRPSLSYVTTSAANHVVDIQKFNYLSFEDISFTGAGQSAFNIVQAKGITIKNCQIRNSGAEAVLASYSPYLTIESCVISNSLSGGINLDAGCTNANIRENNILNTGLFAGMGKSGTGTYEAITSFGDNTIIEKNRIDSVGYNGIYFGGNSAIAKNNYISFFCLTKDDGAGIYLGDWSKTFNKKVEGNIILHGIGNGKGTDRENSLQAEGIYIDDNTESVLIVDNTVSLCSNNGIKLHNAKDINVFDNTVFNNGIQLRLEQDHYIASSKYIRNNNIRRNTFFAASTHQTAAKFSTNQNDIQSFGHIDSNIYCSPKVAARGSVSKNTDKNKPDLARTMTRMQPYDNNIRFEFNASNEARTLTLDSSYVDVQNKQYPKTVTIGPYSSLILIAASSNSVDNLSSVQNALVVNKIFEK